MMAVPPLYGTATFRSTAGDCWRPGGLELTRHGLELCAFAPSSRLLDIGCGAGATLGLLLEFGFNAVGLDKERQCDEGLPFVRGDAAEPPFPSESFDGLLCECVLSLLPDKGAVLRNFARLLRPGGRFLLSDLYLRDGIGSTSALNPVSATPSCSEGAVPRWELEEALKGAGFRILAFEEHGTALKTFAAKLIWYSDGLPESLRTCACSGRRLGYGLWLAELS